MCFAYFFALDYKLDHELLRVGCRFHFQRGAEIPVSGSSMNKTLKLHATDEAVPVTPSIVSRSDSSCIIITQKVLQQCPLSANILHRFLHLSKPGISTCVVPTASAASLMSDGGNTTL